MTKYTLTNVGGDGLTEIETDDQQVAIEDAKQRLREDPELGEVHVWMENTFIGCATHMPDASWQTVVGWLWEGERVLPPAGIPGPPEIDSGAYALTDPKHPTFHERMSDLADLRD